MSHDAVTNVSITVKIGASLPNEKGPPSLLRKCVQPRSEEETK